MRKATPRCNAAAVIATLVAFSLGVMLAVFVAGSASAAASKGTTTKKTTTTTQTTTTTTKTQTLTTPTTTIPKSPADHYFVLYGTANATSDHEIIGSSAFPNYTHGAVDNYYSMANSHVDNSPFAQGTASPADTGPVGQTAAAGNFQQPQYADARWPGDPAKATYGSKGGPYAAAEASDYSATAEASAASNALSGPSAPSKMAAPKGFDGRLRLALAAWRATWQSRPGPKTPAVKGTVKTPTVPVKPPTATVPTPIATVTTPTVGGLSTPTPVPTPPVTAPLPTVPSTSARSTTTSSRSLAASSPSSSSSSSGDGESLLESSSLTHLDPKTNALVTSGESRLGRVSLGGGQIVIEGIHVSASITNDGTPTYKAAVSIASASIGGVPVTIDQDGVHVAGQGQGAPYKQASDALNGALKQAGIQLFLVGPEVTTGTCDQTGTGTGTGNGTTTTTSSDQSGTTPTTSSCDQTNSCPQTGTGTGTYNGTTTTTTSNNQTGTTPTTSSCDQTNSCPQTGTGTSTYNGTTTTSSSQSGTTPTTSSCDQTGMTTPTSSCPQKGKTTTTSSNDQTGTTTTTPVSGDQTGMAPGTTGSGEETVTATGLHVVFTQPVGQSGVPAQNAEHILGEVFLDSLAVPAGPLPDLNLNFSSSSSSSSSCLGGLAGRTKTSGLAAAGGSSSVGGSTSPSSLSPSASGFNSGSSSAGGGVPTSLAELASLVRSKPMWLLLAYLVWQALAVITGASLWRWRRGGAT